MKFIDTLYGEIDLNIARSVLNIPELQRLREVRLCNVNSPYITGGTNLNRFEHAIGTAFLAQELSALLGIDDQEKNNFIIGATLHDIVTPPFGHSLEYLFDALGKTMYEHSQLDTLFSGKTVQYSRPYYLGVKSTLRHKSDIIDIRKVYKLIKGESFLSKYLINPIDIDNIDNVFRFAFHIGISVDKDLPLKLAKSLKYDGNKLVVTEDNYDLFNQWFNVRALLYKYLLENNGEFIAKALLERVFIELINDDIINEFDWILTDFEFVQKAIHSKNLVANECIKRYMLMDFPKYQKIFQVHNYESIDILQKNKIEIVDTFFKNNVFLHFIRDVNKTKRVLHAVLSDNNGHLLHDIEIGSPKDRYLIGFFSDNRKSLEKEIERFGIEFEIKLVDISDDTIKEQTQISLF